jgi:hypothetical protein
MANKLSNVEKRANLIIKYRNYKIIDKCVEKDNHYIYLKKGDKQYIMQIFNTLVGIAVLKN